MKRHTCIICKSKRYENKMEKAFSRSWVCTKDNCRKHKDIAIAKKILKYYNKLSVVNKQHILP